MLLVQEEKIWLRNKDQIANWVHLQTKLTTQAHVNIQRSPKIRTPLFPH